MTKVASILTFLLLFTACGGGSTGDGAGSLQGSTPHAGFWTLQAVITAIVGGTTNNIDTTTKVNIQSNGTVGILETDTDCALSIWINGNTLTYKEQCVFQGTTGTGDDGGISATCILDLQTRAVITSTTLGSGVFGPKSFVCTGMATSYSGTLLVIRDTATTSSSSTSTTSTTTTSTPVT